MKKMEKMSEEYADKLSYGGGFDQATLYEGYVAGFKAAREIAVKTAQNHPNEPGVEPWGWCNICGGGPDIAKSIDQIGEEEV